MPNTEPIRMANGGIPRRLTFDLMREMHMHIWRTTGRKPHDHTIRCTKAHRDAYLQMFGDRLTAATIMEPAFDGVPIAVDLVDLVGAVPADQMEWLLAGQVVGVLADLRAGGG
jgi:hypothetical protein